MINFELLSKSEITNQIHHLDVQLAALQTKELKLSSERINIVTVLTRRLLSEHLELCPEPARRLMQSRDAEIAAVRAERDDLTPKLTDAGAEVELLQAEYTDLVHKERLRCLDQISAMNEEVSRYKTELLVEEADISEIRSEVEGKLIGYNHHSVFVHLNQRNFGQPDQAGNWLTKRIDGILARSYDYQAMKMNFEKLVQIGHEIQQKQEDSHLPLVAMQKKQATFEQELLSGPECKRVAELLGKAHERRDCISNRFRLSVEKLSTFENQDDSIFHQSFSLTQDYLLNQAQSSIEFLERKAPAMTAYFSDLIHIQKKLALCDTDKKTLQQQRLDAQTELSERLDSHSLRERKGGHRNQSRDTSVSDLLLVSALVYSVNSSADDSPRSSDDNFGPSSDNSPGGSDFSSTDVF